MCKHNRLLVGCDMYDITAACRRDAIVMYTNIPYNFNPYNSSTQEYYDWDNGHTNEGAGFYVADNGDVIEAKQNGMLFTMQ